MSTPKTLVEKIWTDHRVASEDDGSSLLHVDRVFLDESGYNCLDDLERMGRAVHSPAKAFMVCSHLVPTRIGARLEPEVERVFNAMGRHHERTGVNLIRPSDPRQGIHHVLSSEQGYTLPGFIIAVTDSHTTTHGALGALGLGLGYAEATHVLATQCLWQPQYKQMRVTIDGQLGIGVSAKDLALAMVGQIGRDGGTGHIIEFAGPTVEALDMPGRFTLCNMSVEAGARAGVIAPDETTIEFVRGKPSAPKGGQWDRAAAYWSELKSDADARFDREIHMHASAIPPPVTWGTSPDDLTPVDGHIPDPSAEPDPVIRRQMERKIHYMGLQPKTPITSVSWIKYLSAPAPTGVSMIWSLRRTCCGAARSKCQAWWFRPLKTSADGPKTWESLRFSSTLVLSGAHPVVPCVAGRTVKSWRPGNVAHRRSIETSKGARAQARAPIS